MERRELVFMDAKSSKFWNIELVGSSHTVTYGRIGSNGRASTKDFPTPEKARDSFLKLVDAKLVKGYVDGKSSIAASDDDALPAITFSSIVKEEDIGQNAKTFVGRRVADYDMKKGPSRSGKTIYRFRSSWDEDALIPSLEHFLASDGAEKAVGIVIGHWGGEDSEQDPSDVVKILVEAKDRLPALIAIYFGDIVSEENEISWIHQTDLSPLLTAFPKLQVLRARGGNDLELSNPQHQALRCLTIETGGMGVELVRTICNSDFPSLEHLELWLGTQEYGGTSTVQDLQPILSGELFPKLKYLGLRNCEYVDDVAAVVVNSPLTERIEKLDLSLGVLTDDGAVALATLPEAGSLKHVSIHHNYASRDALKKLKAHKISFDTSNPSYMDSDDEWRFVSVGE